LYFVRWNFSCGRLGALFAITAVATADSLAKKNKYPAIDTTHTDYARLPSLQMTYTTLESNRFDTVCHENMLHKESHRQAARRHFVVDTR
jgi:ribosomal protein L33